jgi:hypothetical protein
MQARATRRGTAVVSRVTTAGSLALPQLKALTARPVSATLDSILLTVATAIIPLEGIALTEVRA